jgi:hypothetical protein
MPSSGLETADFSEMMVIFYQTILTNFMEVSPSSEAASCAATQEFLSN